MTYPTKSHVATLLRRARKQIADLQAKPPAKNKAGASRRQGAINRAKRLIVCLEAGDHPANWHNYTIDGRKIDELLGRPARITEPTEVPWEWFV